MVKLTRESAAQCALLEELKAVAEKLGLRVREERLLREVGYPFPQLVQRAERLSGQVTAKRNYFFRHHFANFDGRDFCFSAFGFDTDEFDVRGRIRFRIDKQKRFLFGGQSFGKGIKSIVVGLRADPFDVPQLVQVNEPVPGEFIAEKQNRICGVGADTRPGSAAVRVIDNGVDDLFRLLDGIKEIQDEPRRGFSY